MYSFELLQFMTRSNEKTPAVAGDGDDDDGDDDDDDDDIAWSFLRACIRV